MSKDVLNQEAQKLMAEYKTGIEKKAQKDRKKAMKKWKKQNPHLLNVNESNYNSS